ncbi:ribosomal protein S18-alanine N-acetyltransferase [Kangiella taiwanensis]|uniref:[Ribosomal protein bS18]-alanine N-acetyltransferase n=1 Tax=Kangiella taiwanensis TaxID=1079179 RepID=A0ABP8HQW8_9GAMM|nr:ribosomal protein S18-alanine N-acetyltransferase [Kangiella taiwanensis]
MESNSVIRPLEVIDLEQVVTIEQEAHEYPWKKSIHLSCIEQEYPSLVLEREGQILAYVIFNYLYDECHLMNITTQSSHQGQGIATQLIQSLYSHAKLAGMKSVLLEVRESNQPAIAFYQRQQFEVIGQRLGYYPATGGREAAIVMRKALLEA